MAQKEVQEVEVYVEVSGDYCAFHEMDFSVVYDITNDKSLGCNDMTLDELRNWNYDADYNDYQQRSAVLIDGRYFVHWG